MMTTEQQMTQTASVAPAERTRNRQVFQPAADITENSDRILLLADMPGVTEKDVKVSLEKNVLTIEGHVEETDRKGYSLAHTEYGLGDYHRVFHLSDEIEQSRISASVMDGVLRLELPKAAHSKARSIPVKAG